MKLYQLHENRAIPDVYIIMGNPGPGRTWDSPENRPYKRFYDQIKRYVESKGFTISFDLGEEYTEPPGGQFWIGHSRGCGRLRFAPPGVRVLCLDDYEPSHVGATQEVNYQEVPYHMRPKPGPEHYTFNNEMRAGIDKLLSAI